MLSISILELRHLFHYLTLFDIIWHSSKHFSEEVSYILSYFLYYVEALLHVLSHHTAKCTVVYYYVCDTVCWLYVTHWDFMCYVNYKI